MHHLQDPHMCRTTSSCSQTWCNDAGPCSNLPKPPRTTHIRKHCYKITVVNRAKVRRSFWTLAVMYLLKYRFQITFNQKELGTAALIYSYDLTHFKLMFCVLYFKCLFPASCHVTGHRPTLHFLKTQSVSQNAFFSDLVFSFFVIINRQSSIPILKNASTDAVWTFPDVFLIPRMLWVHDPGCLHDPSAHAHNDVVESAHAQMTILFCDDLRHCTICSTLAHLSLLSSVNTIEGIIFLI